MILSDSFYDTMDFISPHLGETDREKMLHIPLEFPLLFYFIFILQIVYFFSQPIQSEKNPIWYQIWLVPWRDQVLLNYHKFIFWFRSWGNFLPDCLRHHLGNIWRYISCDCPTYSYIWLYDSSFDQAETISHPHAKITPGQ